MFLGKKSFLLAFSIFSFFVLGLFSSVNAASTAKVTRLEGKAFVSKSLKGPWKKIGVGATLNRKDIVKTAKNSRLEITLPDGSVIRLSSESRLLLENVLVSKKKKKKKFSFKLLLGKAWTKVKKLVSKDSSFEIKTKNAVAGVRGTTFRLDVEKDESTVVRVYSGAVAVAVLPVYAKKHKKGERVQVPGPQEVSKKKWEEIVLKAMQEVRVTAAGELMPPREFSAEEEKDDEWVMWNKKLDEKIGE